MIIKKTDKIQNGIVKQYYPTGELYAEYNCKDGILEGVYKIYHKNGELMSKSNYKDGKKEIEGNYKDGRVEIIKTYYESGKLSGVTNLKDGWKEYTTKFYSTNGELHSEVNYKNHKKDGLECLYADEKIKEINTYKNGNIINSKKYDTIDKFVLSHGSSKEILISEDNINKTLSDALRTCFVRTKKITVLERTRMDEILKEQKFQLMGYTTNKYVVEVGKILNVKYIVIGNIGMIAKEYIINIRVVSVESSEVVIADMDKCERDNELMSSMQILVEKIAERISSIQDDNESKSIAVLDIEIK